MTDWERLATDRPERLEPGDVDELRAMAGGPWYGSRAYPGRPVAQVSVYGGPTYYHWIDENGDAHYLRADIMEATYAEG